MHPLPSRQRSWAVSLRLLALCILISCQECLVVTGGHAVSAYVGQEVILDCFVDSNIAPEEVSWKKVDSDESLMLVLLFQDNDSHPGHGRYQGRAEFFSTKIPEGNFSLRLKDVKTEDQGEYICEAHSGHLSANATIKLHKLGLSSIHILVLALCCSAIIVSFILNAVIVKDIKDIGSGGLGMHYVLVFLPSVIMFIAFVLWGNIEGFLDEVATCSTVNLIRFILLFKISPYWEHLPDFVKFVLKTGFAIEHFILACVLYLVIFYDLWSREGQTKVLALISIVGGSSSHMGVKGYFGRGGFLEMMDTFFLFLVCFLSRTLTPIAFIAVFLGSILIPLSNLLIILIVKYRYPFLLKSRLYELGAEVYVLIRRLMPCAIIFYFIFQFLEYKERAEMLPFAALFQILALAEVLNIIYKPRLSETPSTIFYMLGAFCMPAVNAITLASELILKSREGQRTMTDLRVVVLPSESVFVLCWIFLWSLDFWKEHRRRIMAEVGVCQQYGCRRWIQVLKKEDTDLLQEFERLLEQPSAASAGRNSPPDSASEAETAIDTPEDNETSPEDTKTNTPGQIQYFPTSSERLEVCDVERHPASNRHTTGTPISVDVHISLSSQEPAASETDSLFKHGHCKEQIDTESGDPATESSTLLGQNIHEGVPQTN